MAGDPGKICLSPKKWATFFRGPLFLIPLISGIDNRMITGWRIRKGLLGLHRRVNLSSLPFAWLGRHFVGLPSLSKFRSQSVVESHANIARFNQTIALGRSVSSRVTNSAGLRTTKTLGCSQARAFCDDVFDSNITCKGCGNKALEMRGGICVKVQIDGWQVLGVIAK